MKREIAFRRRVAHEQDPAKRQELIDEHRKSLVCQTIITHDISSFRLRIAIFSFMFAHINCI